MPVIFYVSFVYLAICSSFNRGDFTYLFLNSLIIILHRALVDTFLRNLLSSFWLVIKFEYQIGILHLYCH